MDAINREFPSTLEGLAVKAKVAALVCRDLWEKPLDQLEWDKEHMRCFIESALRATGADKTPWVKNIMRADYAGDLN
jgi:hypothetical protein